MHVVYAVNELQAAIAHGRRGKSSASSQKHCKLQRLTVNRAISHRVLARGSQNHCNLQHLAVNFAISHEVLAGGSQNHCNLQHAFAPGRGRGLAPEQCRMNLQALTGLGFRAILYTSGLTAGIRRGSGIESGTAYRRSVKGNSNGSSYAICCRCAVALSLSARSARSDRAKCAWNSEPREEFRASGASSGLWRCPSSGRRGSGACLAVVRARQRDCCVGRLATAVLPCPARCRGRPPYYTPSRV